MCGHLQTLEVVAEPTAPLLSYEALLEAAPVEVDQDERLEQLAERAAAQEIVDAAKKDVSSIPMPPLLASIFLVVNFQRDVPAKKDSSSILAYPLHANQPLL